MKKNLLAQEMLEPRETLPKCLKELVMVGKLARSKKTLKWR